MNEQLQAIEERLGEFLLMDGFDKAVIGICERAGSEPVVAYDYQKCIDILIDQGMSEEEAREYFEFNCVGAYVGEKTPAIITTM